MQDIAIFDLVIILITLLLGLKGLFRGFIKEVFGIIGIVGAIFVASRVAAEVGDLFAPILAIDNQSTLKLIGFIVAIAIVWLIVYTLGIVVSKMFSLSGLGVIDRLFGFIFGMAKVFLIFSVIAYALYQVDSFKKLIDEKTQNSILMPYLIDIGGLIIKIDTSKITENLDKATQIVIDSDTAQDIKDSFESTKEDIKDAVTNEVIENLQNSIQDSFDTNSEDIENTDKED